MALIDAVEDVWVQYRLATPVASCRRRRNLTADDARPGSVFDRLGIGTLYLAECTGSMVAGFGFRRAHDAVAIGNVHGRDVLASRAAATIDAIGATGSH